MKSAYTMSSVDRSHDSDSAKTVEAEQTAEPAEAHGIAQTSRSQIVAGFVGFGHGAFVLPPELVAKVFEFDDDAFARAPPYTLPAAACVCPFRPRPPRGPSPAHSSLLGGAHRRCRHRARPLTSQRHRA